MKIRYLLVLLLILNACSYLPQNFDPVSGAAVSETYDYIEINPISGSVPGTGIIFYPGGLVDPHAYIPLVSRMVTNGYHGFIMKAPLNLQVISWAAADSIIDGFDSVTNWFIGGHSLGGTMAARYYYEKESKVKGLYLLAAWPVESWDLSISTNSFLLISASQDEVASQDEILSNLVFLPDTNTITNVDQVLTNSSAMTFWYIIPGGNHAQFGSYGDQDGDGTATISRSQQQDDTAKLILNYIQGRGY